MIVSFFKRLRRLFDKYAVARAEHSCQKCDEDFFSNFVAFSENLNFKYIF